MSDRQFTLLVVFALVLLVVALMIGVQVASSVAERLTLR